MSLDQSVAAAGVIASIIALIVTIVSFLIQMRKTQTLAQSDMLLRLRASFDDQSMRSIRAQAARGIQKEQSPNEALSHVLDWMSQLAWLLESGVITPKLAFAHFGYWVLGYWNCAKGFVDTQRTGDPGSWKSLEAGVALLRKSTDWFPERQRFLEHEVLQVNLCRLASAHDVSENHRALESPPT